MGGPSTSEVDTGDDGDALGDHLSKWVNDIKIKQNAVDSLLKIFKECGHPNVITDAINLELSFNIYRLPLYKSSQNYLWPILCALVKVKPVTVFPVVLTYGKSKPDDLTFLEYIIRYLEYVLENRIRFGNRTLSVVL